jgi:hypothetical protein
VILACHGRFAGQQYLFIAENELALLPVQFVDLALDVVSLCFLDSDILEGHNDGIGGEPMMHAGLTRNKVPAFPQDYTHHISCPGQP